MTVCKMVTHLNMEHDYHLRGEKYYTRCQNPPPIKKNLKLKKMYLL